MTLLADPRHAERVVAEALLRVRARSTGNPNGPLVPVFAVFGRLAEGLPAEHRDGLAHLHHHLKATRIHACDHPYGAVVEALLYAASDHVRKGAPLPEDGGIALVEAALEQERDRHRRSFGERSRCEQSEI
jgi:hypothetical protein